MRNATGERIGRWSFLAAATIGALSLLAILGGLPTSIIRGAPSVTPNAAASLVLLGCAGALRHRASSRRLPKALVVVTALLVLLFGIGLLVWEAVGVDLGVHHLVIGPRPPAPTALALVFSSLALLTSDLRPTAGARPSEWLSLLASLVAFTALVGLFLGRALGHQLPSPPLIGVSLPIAVGFLLLSAGALLERPRAGIMRLITSANPAGTLLRRLVLPTLLGPALLTTVVFHVLGGPPESAELRVLLAALTTTPSAVALLLLGIAVRPLERAHAEVASSRARIRSLVDLAPDGVFTADLEGRYTDVNVAGCEMLGRDRAEIIGKTITDFIPPGSLPQLEREKEKLLRGETTVTEWALRRGDGTYLPVEVSAKILADGRWQGLVRDIRQRKELEAALAEASADLVRAQSVAEVGSWRLDVRRNVLVWSDESYEIFGITPGTPATYETFLSCVHPDDRAFVDRAWKAAVGGHAYDIEHRLLVDGKVKWVREKADLAFDEKGALLGGIGVTHHITERKKREEELRVTQERFELAMRGGDLALWDWNVATGEVVFNARWAAMRGYRHDEIEGRVETWTAGVHPDDWPQVQKDLADHFAGRRPRYESEHRVRTKSGEWIWIIDRGEVFERNARGEPIRMLGTEADITPRKTVEAAIRLAEAKATGVVSISADAIISVDESGRVTQFNQGAEKIFGYTKGEVIGAELEMLLPERLRAAHRAHIVAFAGDESVARRMGQRTMGIFGRRKNGDEFPADAAISRLRVNGTTILTVALRDVTEQRRIEKEERFLSEIGAILSSTLDVNATVASCGKLLTRDLADVCLFYLVEDGGGIRRLDVACRSESSRPVCDALRQMPLDRARAPAIWSELEQRRAVLLARTSGETLASLASSDDHAGVIRALDPKSLIFAPLFAHGKLVGALCLISSDPARTYSETDVRFVEEIAERAAYAVDNAQLYEKAQRAIQSRDNVLGIVAHDLRNPLGNILMQAAMLERTGNVPDRRSRKPAELIERSGRRMSRIIQDLLDVTRMEQGRLSVEQARISPREVIIEAIETQRALASASKLELEIEMARELPEVWADRDRLLQIFENLLGNALKFTPPGGSITVGASRSEDQVLFWVEDTGAGIPAEGLPHVFDRFWQAQKGERRGVGLGLPIVKGLVEAQRGRIWVESTPPRGTTFFFTLPQAPHAEQWTEEAAPRSH